MYSPAIQKLINQFANLPGIGPKTAERLVFHLLYQPQSSLIAFGEAIEHLKNNIVTCSNCFNFSETNPCHICDDLRRQQGVICVVAKPQDVSALEKTKIFNGVYHVLGGTINPLRHCGPENLKVKELLQRLKSSPAQEVIFALNPDFDGETTMSYLSKVIKQYFPVVKLTRLARGLPMGADLEYADEVTLEKAMESRQNI